MAFKRLGKRYSDEKVKQMIRSVDLDNNGKVFLIFRQ